MFTCATAAIEDDFAGLEDSRDGKFTYTYFGNIYGSLREYPSVGVDGICSDYDPRVRPWYLRATTGPKNVILLVDVSETMIVGNKLNILKKTM